MRPNTRNKSEFFVNYSWKSCWLDRNFDKCFEVECMKRNMITNIENKELLLLAAFMALIDINWIRHNIVRLIDQDVVVNLLIRA